MNPKRILLTALSVVLVALSAGAQKPFPMKGENNLYAYFDMDGNQLTEYKYLYAWRFGNNPLARVNVGGEIAPNGTIVGGKWGYVDESGKEVIPTIYDGITKYGPVAMRVRQGELYGLVDATTGEVLLPAVYSQMASAEQKYARVEKDGLWGFIDTQSGKVFVECIYTTCFPFVGGYAKVNLGGTADMQNFVDGGQWGFIEEATGKVELYDVLGGSSEGRTAVARGFKWGFILDSGEVLTEVEYDMVNSFKHGFAMVKKDELWGVINSRGERVVECLYTHIEPFEKDGSARVQLDGSWGCLQSDDDDHVREIVAPAFEFMGPFCEGLARVKMVGRCGFVDRNGAEVVALRYADATDFDGGYAAVKLRNKWGVIDSTGMIVIKPSYATAVAALGAITTLED